MDVPPLEDRRLDAELDGAGANVGVGGLDRFLHHVAELAGDRHLPLAGDHDGFDRQQLAADFRSEEHTSELQSLMRISYAVFCLKKNKPIKKHYYKITNA